MYAPKEWDNGLGWRYRKGLETKCESARDRKNNVAETAAASSHSARRAQSSQAQGRSSQPDKLRPISGSGFRQTLNELPPDIRVRNWAYGAQGQRVGADGVGRQDLIDRGIVDAIDMWGYITPGVEVCFRRTGGTRIVFLDAAYAPRRLFDLRAFRRNGWTCTRIDRAGTVVLLVS